MVRTFALAAAAAAAVTAVSVHTVDAFAAPAAFSSSTRMAPTRVSNRVTSSLQASSVDDAVKTEKKDAVSVETNGQADQVELLGSVSDIPEEENWELDSKVVEFAFLALWLGSLSGFIFANNWGGPFPAAMTHVPERIYFVFHMLGGMLFGGGVIMTTALEWLVVKNKNAQVLQFYFDKVPLLDSAIVLPGLTIGMISGTGLCITRYGSLGGAPAHVPAVFYCLTAFAAWWASTDLATQGKALRAVNEWVVKADDSDVPKIVQDRFYSNIVSCGFVVALYCTMVLKPGTLPQYTPHLNLPNFF